MTDELNEPAKGGNLWLPETGTRTPVNHRKPRWLRIALVWAMAVGFIALTVIYFWDYFDTLAVNRANTELFTKALAAGETTFIWQPGGISSVVSLLLWIPLFTLSFTGFTTARKLLAGDKNKKVAKAWKVIAVLHFIMIVSLFPRLFVGNDAPEQVIKDKGYSIAEVTSNSNEDDDGSKALLAITEKDGEGQVYSAEKTSKVGSYTLELPKDLVTRLNSGE
jgi:hypothetical protein